MLIHRSSRLLRNPFSSIAYHLQMFKIYPFLYPVNKVEYIQVRIMNKKTLAKLEYNKIIEQLIEHASSFSGKELCRRLKPMTDISAIRNAQDETAAAFTRIVK